MTFKFALFAEIAHNKALIETKELDIAQISARLDAEKQNYVGLDEAFGKKIQEVLDLYRERAELKGEIFTLTEDKRRLQLTVDHHQDQSGELDEANTDCLRLQQTISRLEKKQKDDFVLANESQSNLKQLQKTISRLENQRRDDLASVRESQSNCLQLQKTIGRLEKQQKNDLILANESQSRYNKETTVALEGKIGGLETEVKAAKAETKAAKAATEKAETEAKAAKAAAEKSRAEWHAAQSTVFSLGTEIIGLKKEVRAQNQQVENTLKAKATAEEEVTGARIAEALAQQETQEANEAKAAAVWEAEEAKKAKSSIEERLKGTVGTKDAAEKDVKILTTEKADLAKQNLILEQKVRSKDKELNDCRKAIEALQAEPNKADKKPGEKPEEGPVDEHGRNGYEILGHDVVQLIDIADGTTEADVEDFVAQIKAWKAVYDAAKVKDDGGFNDGGSTDEEGEDGDGGDREDSDVDMEPVPDREKDPYDEELNDEVGVLSSLLLLNMRLTILLDSQWALNQRRLIAQGMSAIIIYGVDCLCSMCPLAQPGIGDCYCPIWSAGTALGAGKYAFDFLEFRVHGWEAWA